jgi:hypothetical protein
VVHGGDDLALALDAFYQEHRLCAGAVSGDVNDVSPSSWRVWMTCSICQALFERLFRLERDY